MFGDRGSRSPRSLNRHRSLIGSSCAFLSIIKCPIDRTRLRVFSQRVTPGVLLWIVGVRNDYRGKREVLEERYFKRRPPNPCDQRSSSGSIPGGVTSALAFTWLPIREERGTLSGRCVPPTTRTAMTWSSRCHVLIFTLTRNCRNRWTGTQHESRHSSIEMFSRRITRSGRVGDCSKNRNRIRATASAGIDLAVSALHHAELL